MLIKCQESTQQISFTYINAKLCNTKPLGVNSTENKLFSYYVLVTVLLVLMQSET